MTIWIPDLSSHRGPRYLAIADALAIDIRSQPAFARRSASHSSRACLSAGRDSWYRHARVRRSGTARPDRRRSRPRHLRAQRHRGAREHPLERAGDEHDRRRHRATQRHRLQHQHADRPRCRRRVRRHDARDTARAFGFGQRRRPPQLPVQWRQPYASRSGRQAARAIRRAGRSRSRPHHRRRAARDHGGARRADRTGRHRADREPDLARPAPARRLPALPRAGSADGQGRHPARRVRSRLPRPQHQGALLRHQPAEPDLDRGAGAAPARAGGSRAALWREDRRGRRLRIPRSQRAAADGQFRAGARRVLQQRFQVDGARACASAISAS